VKEKAPAVQWYPKQALGDDKILAMDWDAKGMHYTLCWISWQQEPPGTIPDDAALIRRWLNLSSDATDIPSSDPGRKDHSPVCRCPDCVWRRVSPQLYVAWPLADVQSQMAGRRVNSGMVRAAEKQKIFSESRAKSAKVRWDAHAVRKQCESTEDEEEGFVLPDFIPEKAWNSYLEMRAKQKKPMTDHAKDLAVKELSRLKAIGHDPEAVLNQSTMNSWQGLFEVRAKNGKHTAVNTPELLVGKNDLQWDFSDPKVKAIIERERNRK